MFLQSDSNKSETYEAILQQQNLQQIEESFDSQFDTAKNKYSMHSFGAQFAEV